MENKNIQIDIRLVWALVVADLTNTFFAIYTRGSEIGLFTIFLLIVLGVFLQLIIISDIVKNNVYNKPFWIISMIIFQKPASLLYLIQRAKLIRMGNK